MNASPPVPPKAFVIGAGIAGLSAAWRLQQAGFAVEVFEREAQVNGRIKSISLGGCTIDTGATVFLPAYAETLALIRELGMEGELQPVRGQVAVPRGGRLHLIDMDAPLRALGTGLIGWRSKLALAKLPFTFMAVRKALNFVTLGSAQGHDLETLAAYCARSFPSEVYEYLLNPALKFLYLHNGESGSMIELLWWMHANGSGKPRSLRRGSSSLTAALAERLTVHTRSEVLNVQRQDGGVELSVRHGETLRTHRADVCLVTVPGPIAAEIASDDLSDAQRQFLRGRRYDLSTTVSFCTRKRPTTDALMFMMPDSFNANLATIIFGHNIGADRVPADRGVVNAYFMKDWSERHRALPDDDLVRAAQQQVGPLIPEVLDPIACHVQRWPYSAAITEPGDCARIAAFEAEVDATSPIQFCGDYLAQASMNVAVAGAAHVAGRLIRQHASR